MCYFNPRSREGSDDTLTDTDSAQGISIHAPAKGATHAVVCPRPGRGHFNPRSREGSDGIPHTGCLCKYRISIHAPAKGATHCGDYLVMLEDISIHAPAKGATLDPSEVEQLTKDFNPRSREGSDAPAAPLTSAAVISIHAPAKGATGPPVPLSRRGGFQSTLPRRERLSAYA